MILEGKALLVTGVLTESSLAFSVARCAQEEGAEIVLTSYGRAKRITERTAKRLPRPPSVLELDVTRSEDFLDLRDALAHEVGTLDGALHAIAAAPPSCFGNFLGTPWEDASSALQVSAFSLKALTEAIVPLMPNGGSIVALDFDARYAWPIYDWMGVAKAALESTARYLSLTLGPRNVRINLVCAGPVKTVAAQAIPMISLIGDRWGERAPLGWDYANASGVAKTCVALFSDWLPLTTGEMIHADGGFHAVGY